LTPLLRRTIAAMPTTAPDPAQITGLVLAGGRGSRMGGVDKGLQLHRGQPLAMHALHRLRPQVGRLLLSANRHLDVYRGFGAPVCTDALPDHPGPLAGLLAGLDQAATSWLACVPCDTPDFPADLVARLADGLATESADLAVAATLEDGMPRTHPVFCLLRTTLAADLRAALAGGERRVGRWMARHRRAVVVFDEAAAFFNANTAEDLQRLQDR
jgi:molybdopterin-guanine dinucleotide biosynthesis protein A